MERRVVVTGMGAITPIGNNIEQYWDGLKNGKLGIDFIKGFDAVHGSYLRISFRGPAGCRTRFSLWL